MSKFKKDEIFTVTALKDGKDNEIEYEEDIIDEDFVTEEELDDFDYDSYRMHKYDNYTGRITVEIALVKYEALLRSIVGKYARQGAEYEELLQIGFIELAKLIPKNEDNPYLSNFLKRRLQRKISYTADSMSKKENPENREDSETIEDIVCTAIGYDWQEREIKMFLKVSEMLTAEEMKLVYMLYANRTQRYCGKQFNISHAAVQKRLQKIRQKLMPLKPWLEDRTEFPCTDYEENYREKR